MPETLFGTDIRGIAVVAILVFLPILFFALLNILYLLEKLLIVIERILIRVFGDIVGRVFRVIFGVLGAFIGVLKVIFSFGRSKRTRT